MNKIFWFDVETTGTKAGYHDIIQIAGMLEVNGEVVESFNFKVQPFRPENADPQALEVHGMSLEKITGPGHAPPGEVYCKLIDFLGRHINKFSKGDRAYIGGYNVSFDVDFLMAFTKDNKDLWEDWNFQRDVPPVFSYLNFKLLDPRYLFYVSHWLGTVQLESYKLEDVAKHYKVEIKAHDALSDVRATREVFYKLVKRRPGPAQQSLELGAPAQ